jgi:hypothetical protein
MSEVISQKIEREVRYLIGDLHMQVIVLRAALDTTQPQPEQPKPAPPPPPQPIPPQPEHDEPPPKSAKTNGATQIRG